MKYLNKSSTYFQNEYYFLNELNSKLGLFVDISAGFHSKKPAYFLLASMLSTP